MTHDLEAMRRDAETPSDDLGSRMVAAVRCVMHVRTLIPRLEAAEARVRELEEITAALWQKLGQVPPLNPPPTVCTNPGGCSTMEA